VRQCEPVEEPRHVGLRHVEGDAADEQPRDLGLGVTLRVRVRIRVRARARARARIRVRVCRVDLGLRGARLAGGGGRSDAGRDPRDAAGSDHGLARLGQEQRRGRRPDADPHHVWLRCALVLDAVPCQHSASRVLE